MKNGWTAHSATGKWNVDCVASWDHYPRTLDYGATVCRDVTATVLKKLG